MRTFDEQLEQGKPAENTQMAYKYCVVAMMLCFLMLIMFMVYTYGSRNKYQDKQNYSDTAKQTIIVASHE